MSLNVTMPFCCCCCDKSKAKVDDDVERAKPLIEEEEPETTITLDNSTEKPQNDEYITSPKKLSIGAKSITDMLKNQPSISEYSGDIPKDIESKRGSLGAVSISDMLKNQPSWLDDSDKLDGSQKEEEEQKL